MNRPSGNPDKESIGVGMPEALKLHQYGDLLWSAFETTAYHVGSSLTGRQWRDVDVRVLLSDEEYDRMFDDMKVRGNPHTSGKWCAFVLAFSALGREITGLPIDFQIQRQSDANEKFSGKDGHLRSALILIPHRFADAKEE